MTDSLLQTPPFVDVPIIGGAAIDLIDPSLVLTVWRAPRDAAGYRIVRLTNRLTGRPYFFEDPPAYLGTWVQAAAELPCETWEEFLKKNPA